jgi:hypothetical protein
MMKYIIDIYKGRKSATIRLLSFFFFGYRYSKREDQLYLRVSIGLHSLQLSLQFSWIL